MPHNTFNTLDTFKLGSGKTGQFYSLPKLEKAGIGAISKLPVSIRIVLESVLRNVDGKKISEQTSRPDLEAPFMYWLPSIAISGMAFYTGDRFPAWKGNVFVGAMFEGRTRGTGHLQRITFTEGRPIQREPILIELRQRIRDVRQGPDGLLYVLTDEDNGALLKLEPAGAR